MQRLARRVWTDYNLHDPGCTALELLCYALTDLSYRASLPIEDLLASGAGATGTQAQFFTACQILPNRALTDLDYRKLLIDLAGVKNAWVRPAELTYYTDPVAAKLLREKPALPGIRDVHIRGLYDVRIEFMDQVNTAAAQSQVIEAARARLEANRNLCEEFVSVAQVERQSFLLCAEIVLAPDADAAKTNAEVLYRVKQCLAPPVDNYSLGEMLERRKADGSRYTVQEIFDGPALDCGFIDDAQLTQAALRSEIRLSDLISVVMGIDGVRAVRDMLLSPDEPDGEPLADKWRVPVEAGKQPQLNSQGSRLTFFKGNMPVSPRTADVEAAYQRLVDAERARVEGEHRDDLPVPAGRERRPGSYYSAQNHFPAIYGLSEEWPRNGDEIPDAVKQRSALAFQLKAYLLFFDQLMADYCAQLSRVKDLFSTDPTLRRTYFSQVVSSFPDSDRVYAGGPAAAGPALEALIEDVNAGIERRNRFLDHLIARFAERFHDYAAVMATTFGVGPAGMVAPKCEFLQNYPAISSERSLAYNRSLRGTGDLWNTTNVSGYERRLARLLGIRDSSRRDLSVVPYDLYPEVDSTPGDEFRFRVRNRTTGEIVLSSSTNYATRDQARAEMERALSIAQLPEGFQRKVTTDGRYYFNVVDQAGDVIARRIAYFATEEQRDAAIDHLMAALKEGPSVGEGMYVVENILLRPELPDDTFLPICIDPNCTDCSDDDPYSYRVHVVLPAYAGRFAMTGFRRFAEELIREETPAHILPKVCWINKDGMVQFERAYRDWLELAPGAPSSERQEKHKTLVDLLYSVKNVYPAQQLRACDSEETQPKFILGQTALGSEESAESSL